MGYQSRWYYIYFHIRDGVKFSDGEVCDAYAIKANFDAIIENKERHTWLE